MPVAACLLVLLPSMWRCMGDRDLENGVVELKKGNTREAVVLLQRSHGRGNIEATKTLFRIYALGLGTTPDEARARALLPAMSPAVAAAEVEGVVIALEQGHYSQPSPIEAERWRDELRALRGVRPGSSSTP